MNLIGSPLDCARLLALFLSRLAGGLVKWPYTCDARCHRQGSLPRDRSKLR